MKNSFFIFTLCSVLCGCASNVSKPMTDQEYKTFTEENERRRAAIQKIQDAQDGRAKEEHDAAIKAEMERPPLKAGMSWEEAKAILGTLQAGDKSDGLGGEWLTGYHRDSTALLRLYFHDGRLVRWSTEND